MDRLRDLEVFLAIASEGSLTAAASRLGMSAPAVTRALVRLEDRLGAALVVRTTRSLSLTAAGTAYVPQAREVLEAMARADATVVSGQALRGTLRLTAPRQLGRIVVAPILAEFLAQHPGVTARLILADRMVHLLDEGIDLGVRIGHLSDSTAIARKVGFVCQHLVASSEYLAEAGIPEDVTALSRHRLIAFTGHLPQGRLRVAGGTVPFAPVHLEVDCAATALELAERSVGIAPLWSYQCAASVRAGHVVPVLSAQMPPSSPCHVIWPERRFENALVRAFVDDAAPIIQAKLEEAAAAIQSAQGRPAGSG